jgi:hypothetical protein
VTTIDVEQAKVEFAVLKQDNIDRNTEYYLNRQAVKGNFRWPRDWPNHIPKLKHNFCKPITERFSTYLMGRGFTYNVDRPNTLEFRDQAERTEKILRRLLKLAKSDILFSEGADTGSQLGRTVYKVYKTGPKGRQHACFQHVQPDYFYGIPATDSPAGEWAKVFYSYPIDRSEAVRMFGPNNYKSEAAIAQAERYDNLPEEARNITSEIRLDRRVPVLEVWQRDAYLLEVGGVVIYNGDNPFKWTTTTKEGFIPFIVIENIRNDGDTFGESDIAQSRELNEQFNYLLSRKQYIVGRWLQPTLVWEGAPQNYLDILTSTIGGGGAIPARLGSRLYFLAYDRPNPQVQELEQTLRTAILETAGLNEIAFQGTVHGYVNTGPSVNAQYQPLTSVIQKKQQSWQQGIELLFAMLLELQESIGDSEALGLTVVNSTVNSKNGSDGDVVQLSGQDIAGLREVAITWPGLLPKDDASAAQLELQKAEQGLQSIYTTLEKLGEDYPDDEIARIRMENTDPALKGEKVAEQMRAQGQFAQQTANAQATLAGAGGDQGGADQENAAESGPGDEQDLLQQGNIGARLRQLARNSQPQLDQSSGDEPVLQQPGGATPGAY